MKRSDHMQEEIAKIIKMVEEGKVSAEEASELINALKEEEVTSAPDKGYMGKKVKIRIHSEDKEKVRVNIPIRFVKWILKTGHGIASSIPEARAYADDIDMDVLMHAIDNGIDGKIIDLDTEEGESIAIYIE